MIDACFIVDTLRDATKTSQLADLVRSTLGVEKIMPFYFNDAEITKEKLVKNNYAKAPYADLEATDMNKLVKFVQEQRTLTVNEIRSYLTHTMAWKMMLSKNVETVLVIDNTVNLIEEYVSSFKEEMSKILANMPDLYSIIALGKDSYMASHNIKFNEFFYYTDKSVKTHLCYLIHRRGAKFMLENNIYLPMRSPIDVFINDYGLFNKNCYHLKNPLFQQVDHVKPKDIQMISQHITNQTRLFDHVYIVSSDPLNSNTRFYCTYFNKQFKMNPTIVGCEDEIENEKPVLVIKQCLKITNINKFFVHTEILRMHLPHDFKFIGFHSDKKPTIKHPFEFSNHLERVHPEMSPFSAYVMTPKGAKILKENKEDNILALSREHNCFAYKAPIFTLISD